MPKKSKTAVAILLLLILTTFAFGQNQKAPRGLETFLRNRMEKNRIPGLQFAVVKGDRIVADGAFGIANVEDSVLVTKQTVFSINSATKSFTGVAMMQLAEAGKLDLDAPISRYLDELPSAWQNVTSRQLLSHRSGIPNIMNGNGDLLVTDDFPSSLEKVVTLPMESKPGERFAYNQTNYLLLGKIIDKLSGQPFIDFIRQKQFAPAGVTNADWGDFYDVVPKKAKSYAFNRFGDERLTNHYEAFPKPLRTAAGINTTATELARWIIALKSGRLVKKQSLATLWKAETSDIEYLLNGYALGFPSIVRAKHPAVGGIGGGRSAFLIYPEDDLAVVVLTNRLGASPELFIDDIAAFFVPSMKSK